jgi:hypothetical protein
MAGREESGVGPPLAFPECVAAHFGKGLRPLHNYKYCMFLDKGRPYVDKLVLICFNGMKFRQ